MDKINTHTVTSSFTEGIRQLNENPDWTEYIFQKTGFIKHTLLRYAPGSQIMQDSPSIYYHPQKNNVQPSGDSETCSSMTNPSLTS
jgi:hypothetical protein